MKDFLNEHDFDLTERLFLEQTFQRLGEALYAYQRPLTAFEIVTDWPELYKEEMKDISDSHRERISATLRGLGFSDSYLWSR